ncbi:hypothetical protein HDV00_009460 [Rhizophlyctis rosea]|nr:hypothetical protein HDV00_009460 [Rhizophlyctis rosea]
MPSALIDRLSSLRKKYGFHINKVKAPSREVIVHHNVKSAEDTEAARNPTISAPDPHPSTRSILSTPNDITYFETLFDSQVTPLLRFCGTYSPEQQSTILSLAKCYVTPYLGPAPTIDPVTGGLVCAFPSYMCDDHSPVEYSLKFGREGMEVRFSVEPLSCTGRNVDNLEVARMQLEDIKVVAGRGFNAASFNKLKECIAGANAAGRPENNQRFTQFFVGLDFGKEGILAKGYCISVLADLEDPSANVAAIDRFADVMGVGEAWEVVKGYAREVKEIEGVGACYDIISADYTDDNQRVKIYARYSLTTPTLLLQHLTLNNRITIPNLETYASTIWSTFFESHTHLTGPNKILYYYDLRPNGKIGTSKVYIPVLRHYKTESETARRVCRLLRAFNVVTEADAPFEEKYMELLSNLYPYRSLDGRNGGQTHLGISFKADGSTPELIQYFNSEVYAPERSRTGAPTVVLQSDQVWEWQKQFVPAGGDC